MKPQDVMGFWFEPPAQTEDELMAKVRRWFRGGPAMDDEVIERFGDAVREAVDGGFEEWLATARGRLALVLLLDQLTRNVYRNQARMYAGDARAQQLALEAFADGSANELAYIEKLFLSMPLLHAEDLAMQKRLGEITGGLASDVPPLYERLQAMHLEQSDKFTGVIGRFGRFPHRNEILGRESTDDERELLLDWAEKGPPRGAPGGR